MRQVFNITCYEILHISKDIVLLGMVFLIPLVYVAFLGCIYITGVLGDIPLGIVDKDNSGPSREMVTFFENSPRFERVKGITTGGELEAAMNNGTVRAGIILPEDFGEKVEQHREARVQAVYDASNLVWGYNIKRYTMQVVNDFNTRYTGKYLAGKGYTESETAGIMDAVNGNIEVWYNPTYSYITFLLPGLVLVVLHQLGLLSVSLSVTREKASNSWIHYLCSPLPRWKLFLGKALPYFLALFFNYGLTMWVTSHFLGVKILGSTGLLVLLGLLFSVIITATGFFISVWAPDSLQVTRYIMISSVFIFIISGFTWPGTHIPAFINILARALPYTWLAEGFRLVTLKELGIEYIWPNILALSLMAALSVALALRFDKQ